MQLLQPGFVSSFWYFPFAQPVHDSCAVPPLLLKPIGQFLHDKLPITFSNFPVKHGKQKVTPCSLWYWPFSQATQLSADVPTDTLELNLWPLGQLMQPFLPGTCWYLPAVEK